VSKGLLAQVARTIGKWEMLVAGDLCLVAVSGGPDSMALTHVLWRLRERLGVRLRLTHFNHGLREEASRDEQVVVRFAKSLGLPVSLGRAEGLRMKGRSVEDAARQARYAFLERTKDGVQATKIALGHTADDQVETILLKLFRGAGISGMGGMLPVRDGIFIRPLLDSWREQVSEYCLTEGLEPAFDETNLDTRFARNWIRLNLAPLLDDRLGGWKKAVVRSGRLAAEERQALAEWVEEAERGCLLAREERSITLSKASLKEMGAALRGAVLRGFLAELTGSARDLGEATISEVWALADSGGGYGIREIRKGLWAEKEYDRLRLFASPDAPASHPTSWREVSLHVPGQVRVPELGLTISATGETSDDRIRSAENGQACQMAIFDLTRLGHSLKVRAWQAGDRFQPPGLRGHKKLQDFFVDRKVPRQKRGRIPIVTDNEGGVAWIVGYAVDERFKVGPDTEKVAVLRAVWSAEESIG